MKMQGSNGFGARRRYLAEQEVVMAELFGKAAGFTTPITKPTASFKAPSASAGAAKPKAAALKPTGNTLPSATQRLSALKQNLVGQTAPGAGAPSAVGTVGKKDSKRNGALVATGGAGVLAATQADPALKRINAKHAAAKTSQADALKTSLDRTKAARRSNAVSRGNARVQYPWTRSGNKGASRRTRLREEGATSQMKAKQGQIGALRAQAAKGRFSGKQRLAFQAVVGGGGAAAAYAGLRRNAVDKRDKRDVDSLAMGAAGGVALHQGAYVPTKLADKRAETKIKNTEGAQAKVNAHRTAHGLDGVKAGDPRWKGYFRSYPTSVPGGKLKRTLSYTHSGKSGMATGAAVIGGSALAVERLRRRGKFQSQQASRVAKDFKTSISDDDAKHLVERHGLKGPLPKTLNREQKMAAYEARYVSAGGHKAEKWNHRASVGDRVKNTGLAVATAGGAGWLATRGKLKGKALSPKIRHHAETIAGAGATAGGAGELYAAHARHKRSSYASAPAGVARSALTRMRDYTP